MKLKRNALIVLILGFFISILGFLTPIVCWNIYPFHKGAIGIIGGADAPTYIFMLSALFGDLPFTLVLLGISLIVSSAFCLLFSKTVIAHCNITTSAISLALSGVGALGLACGFICFAIASLGNVSKYPIEYPVSAWLGVLCFFAFVVLVVLYFEARKTNWSIKGIIIDVLTSIVYLPVFFFVFAYLYEKIT